MQIEIKRLQQSLGVTVIYVTHDQEEALTMSDRVAVMNAGNLIQIGTPSELYNAPATPFVADFIGKMNFLDGHCIDATETALTIQLAAAHCVKIPAACVRGPLRPQSGAAVKLAVRPEHVRLAERGRAHSATLPGVIETAIFAGSFQTFLVRTLGETTLYVQAPAGSAAPAFRSGDPVDILLEPSALHAFAGDSGPR
jgi:mannopine transport system ATP-binding protein